MVKTLPITIRKEYDAGISEVLNEGKDGEVLKMIRKDSTHLTVLTRLANEASKNTQNA